ncbi:MAG: DNA translocase FtsK 4TM domain-containing protein, partial [Prevotella sp.]|nr:DNA translocase FtsK 4TM domain-containing protein [Prevotella sp.]
MTRKKSDRKPKNIGEAVGFRNIFNSEKTDFLIGLVLLLLAIYTIIVMVSYLSTGQSDQSLLDDLRPGEWINTNREFANYGSSIGAIVAYELMYVNFGLPSFLIPAFIILAGLKMMAIYKINLWKWFFGTMLVMIWSSVTFAKFLTPIMGDFVFNPGGNHGLYCVQHLENIVGPPGLTVILFFTAIAFLTYLSAETIEVVKKAMNPVKYLTSKVKFTVTNHEQKNGNTEIDTENNDEAEVEAKPLEAVEIPETMPEDIPSPIVDLTDFGNTISAKTDNLPENISPTAIVAPIIDKDSNTNKLTIEVAKDEEKADSNKVNIEEILSTPIDPLEPFTKYKRPTLELLKKYDNDGKPNVDMEEIKA